MNKLQGRKHQLLGLVVALGTASALPGCGTRAGNPKKPDPDKQLVRLPSINMDIPENDIDETVSASFALTAQDGGNSAKLATGIPSGRRTVLSFNEFAAKVNEDGINLDETYTAAADGKTITALVSSADEMPYKYRAVFCADKKLFLHVTWSEDGQSLNAVRHIDQLPYDEIRARHDNDGTSIMQEIVWNSADAVQLSVWQTRVPPARQTVVKRPDRIIDAFKIRIDEQRVAEFTGVSDLQFKATDAGNPVDMSDFIADIRVAGQIRPDKKHFYLGHLEGANLICPQEFDEDNQDKPGWCFGLRRRDLGKKDYSLLKKPEIDTAWGLIDDMEIVREDALKEVAFSAGAVCPE